MAILPLESLIQFFKIQFMHKYVQGFLPSAFNNVWVNRENMRGADFSVALRNSDNLYCTSLLPCWPKQRDFRSTSSQDYGVNFHVRISRFVEIPYSLILC